MDSKKFTITQIHTILSRDSSITCYNQGSVLRIPRNENCRMCFHKLKINNRGGFSRLLGENGDDGGDNDKKKTKT